MKTTLRCRIKPYIQPFERELAIAELAAMAGADPYPVAGELEAADEFEVVSESTPEVLAENLAYWESIVSDHQSHLTTQVVREATANVARNGVELQQTEWFAELNSTTSLPRRRCLRYGPHGIHEYRGKFFPQLVRSLLNIAEVPEDGLVVDPMSGSGTSLVEALLSGHHAVGMDMNPLSVYMGQTKCSLLSATPEGLLRCFESIQGTLADSSCDYKSSELEYFPTLPPSDQEYLSNWFAPSVLAELDKVAVAIKAIDYKPACDLMWMSLSNVLRSVSWQKVDDLRVRREEKSEHELDPVREFLEELRRSLRIILAFLHKQGDIAPKSFDLEEGNATQLPQHWRRWLGKVDVVITSPPYATALPYIDTDRLSLSYLGLLSRSGQRDLDPLMIGNREVTKKQHDYYWQSFEENREKLPDSTTELIERIRALNLNAEVGFRRRNLPALLGKYFLDMRQVLSGIRELLKPGCKAYVVVGNNSTTAGGEKVDINTVNLLGDVGETVGLEHGGTLPMDMLTPRDIFRKNAMASEEILEFRRPIK